MLDISHPKAPAGPVILETFHDPHICIDIDLCICEGGLEEGLATLHFPADTRAPQNLENLTYPVLLLQSE